MTHWSSVIAPQKLLPAPDFVPLLALEFETHSFSALLMSCLIDVAVQPRRRRPRRFAAPRSRPLKFVEFKVTVDGTDLTNIVLSPGDAPEYLHGELRGIRRAPGGRHRVLVEWRTSPGLVAIIDPGDVTSARLMINEVAEVE